MPLFSSPESDSPQTPQAWLYAHCDGGSRGNPGPSGYGAILTDAEGHTVAELSDFLGIRTNNFAEYSGLLAVLSYALEHGHRRLKVVSDSLLMVSQVQGKYKVNSADLKPLWQEARNRIARLDGFEISHALRHKNKAADALANQAMDGGTARNGSDPKLDTPSSPALVGRGSQAKLNRSQPQPEPTPTMHRGFTKDGTIHLLGGATLPDGIFVKIIRE